MGTLVIVLGVLGVCFVIQFLCWIWYLALGFQRHWGWGLALLAPTILSLAFFCSPSSTQHGLAPVLLFMAVAAPVTFIWFIIIAWPEAKYPFFWSIGTTCVVLAAFYFMIFMAVETSQQLQAMMQQRGLPTTLLDRARALHPVPDEPRPPIKLLRTAPSSPSPADQYAPELPPSAVFRLRLPPPRGAPGEREPAQPGIYYLLERVVTRSVHGVQAGEPGERVILLERLPGSKMHVTVGNADFVVFTTQLTDDVNVAREVEKRDFVARGGRL